jgi:Uma2 family endonuclease
VATQPKPLDYAAYLRTPETMRRYDIVDGEWRWMSPAPGFSHQRTIVEVLVPLKRHVERNRLGEVYLSPADVIVSKNPVRTRQPDLMFISNSRSHLIGEDDRLHGGPDLVVEILSPGNRPKQVEEKLRDYASVGTREAWILDRKQKTIAVLHVEKGEFRRAAVYSVNNRLRSKVLPRLALSVSRIFR